MKFSYIASFNLIFIIYSMVFEINCHGRLKVPAARNSAWRYGFGTPANYDDMSLYCGAVHQLLDINSRNCGICGDPASGPRHHEQGGRYATNTIVATYTQGQMISVTAELTANHMGFMELRICEANGATEVTQACLNQNLLVLGNGLTRLEVVSGQYTFEFQAQLPAGLSCQRCVMQWRYRAGNNPGSATQEEFYNCADVTITGNGNANSNGNGDGGGCRTYTVKSGDYCYRIEQAHNLASNKLIEFNPDLVCTQLYVGQVLCVSSPAAATTISSTSTVPTTISTNSVYNNNNNNNNGNNCRNIRGGYFCDLYNVCDHLVEGQRICISNA